MFVQLSNGYHTLVDDTLTQTHPLLFAFTWRVANGYVKVGDHYLHRLIAGASGHWHTHHRNENTLDNRRENLMLLTRQDHARLHKLMRPPMSACGYKGVSGVTGQSSYRAYIRYWADGIKQQVNLGTFHTPEAAALAYNAALDIYFPTWPCYRNLV